MRTVFIRSSWLAAVLVLSGASVSAQNRVISTYAGPRLPANGELAAAAAIDSPGSVAADGTGGFYVASQSQNRVYRISANGELSLVAGSGLAGYGGDGGPAASAQLNGPRGIALGSAGDLYIADTNNHRIRRVNPAGVITTVAGTGTAGIGGDGGPATSARLSSPLGIAVDLGGNLYIADSGNHRVRQVTAAGVITTVAGTGTVGSSGDGGPATSAQLRSPNGVAVDAAGILYIADSYNNRIRQVTSAGIIVTVAGTGTEGYGGDEGAAEAAQ
jgi:sugar lactone lactonase YvrE